MPKRNPIKIQENAFGVTIAGKELIREIGDNLYLYSKASRFFNNFMYHLSSLKNVRKPTRNNVKRILLYEAKTKIITNDTLPIRVRQLLINCLVAQYRISNINESEIQ